MQPSHRALLTALCCLSNQGVMSCIESQHACAASWLQALERGYWPSYNVPYYEDIYRRSGYPDAVKRVKALGPQYHDIVTGGRVKGVWAVVVVQCSWHLG
jgi:hypothetical protein